MCSGISTVSTVPRTRCSGSWSDDALRNRLGTNVTVPDALCTELCSFGVCVFADGSGLVSVMRDDGVGVSSSLLGPACMWCCESVVRVRGGKREQKSKTKKTSNLNNSLAMVQRCLKRNAYLLKSFNPPSLLDPSSDLPLMLFLSINNNYLSRAWISELTVTPRGFRKSHSTANAASPGVTMSGSCCTTTMLEYTSPLLTVWHWSRLNFISSVRPARSGLTKHGSVCL